MSEEGFVEQTTPDVTQDSSPVAETVAPTEDIVADDEFDGESAETTEQPVAGTGAERRIKQLAAQRRSEQEARIKAEREAAYYRGLSEARGGVEPKKPEPQQPAVPPKPEVPVLDHFETFEEYERAKDEYLIQLAEHRVAKNYEQFVKQHQQQTVRQQYMTRINEAAASDPTILEIANDPTLPVSEAMGEIIQQSDIAPNLLKWLSGNRREAQRIMGLPPVLAAKELGYIEATIKNAPKPTPPKRVSAAPEPIQPLTPTSPSSIDDDDLPMDEYYRRRTKQIYGRG